MSGPALALGGVSKTFGGQRALRSVDLEIRKGEVHALVGENGSGKSTLIKILSGYHSPDPGGTIAVDGETMLFGDPEQSRRRGLRFVHQDLGLIEQFSVLENFGITSGFPTRFGGIDWAALRRVAQQVLDRVGVAIDLDAPVAELSAVERTALAIARSLDDSQLGAPLVLVLDEPTAALPADDVERLLGIVREVAARGVGVLYVSHRLDEVIELSDRITVIRDGAVVATAAAASLDRARVVELIVGAELEADDDGFPAPESGNTFAAYGIEAPTLFGASLTVGPGEILGIAGLDGSGREVIARCLVGDTGRVARIEINGEPVQVSGPKAAADAGIALVLANRDPGAAVRGLSIAENVRHVSLARSNRLLVDSRAERERVGHWIERLDIRPPEPDRDYATLSGGNRQKVIFAKWLDIGPRVLVLDDPTSGVDVGARRSMYRQIRDVASAGVPVIVASSDLEDLSRLCSRVLVLSAGAVRAELRDAQITEASMTFEMSRDREARKTARPPERRP